MKKLFLILMACLTLSPLISISGYAEEIADETYYSEEGFVVSLSTPGNPRYLSTSENCLFEANYTNAQKSVILREFLVERLFNLEKHQNELSLGTYGSNTLLYIDLAELNDFQLYYNTANRSDTKEIIKTAMSDIVRTPRLFWYGNYYVISWKIRDGKVEKLGLKLNCYKDTDVKDGLGPVIDSVYALTSEFDGYVQKITDLIPDSYSDYEKILFANDYLCVNYKYDSNYSIYNAYDFFKEGTGVCQAYTLAFMAIMDELDIKCDYVSSKEMNHAWNLVRLNGKWYHIDVTWNDPCFSAINTDMVGQATHKYFLLSSDCMQDDSHNHYGFNIDSYGYEIGNEFDDVDVDLNRSLKSPFVELNGIWYNTGYDNETRTCGLYAFNSPDISHISKEDLTAPLYKMGLWTTSGSKYYPHSYSYLARYNNTILFNTPTSICMFDGNIVTELYTPVKSENERIYGFAVKDNLIYIQLATDPNENAMRNATIKTLNLFDIIYQNKLTIDDYNETTRVATIYAPIEIEGVIFFASYDENNIMVDCKFAKCSFTTGINEYTVPYGFYTDGAKNVTIMLLENVASLKPLCEVYTISIGTQF